MSNSNKTLRTNTINQSVINDWTLDDWVDKVERLPEVKAAGLVDVFELTGGTVNKSFKVVTKKDIWAVRFNNDELPGIHRPTEAKILETIKPLSIAPETIVYNTTNDYLITKYFDGEPWTVEDLSNPEKLNQLSEKLAPLHRISFQSKRTELVFRLVEYIHYFSKMDSGIKSAINKIVTELIHLGFWKKQTQLLHFDLNPLNIMDNGEDIRIIDWEYAGAGHPLIEWCVIQNYAQKDISRFAPQYPHINYHKKVQELIDLMMQMWQE